jgi:hypothetical protein
MRMHSCLHLLGSVLRYGVTGGQITAERGSTSTPRKRSTGSRHRGRERLSPLTIPSSRSGLPTRNSTAAVVRGLCLAAATRCRADQAARDSGRTPPCGARHVRPREKSGRSP